MGQSLFAGLKERAMERRQQFTANRDALLSTTDEAFRTGQRGVLGVYQLPSGILVGVTVEPDGTIGVYEREATAPARRIPLDEDLSDGFKEA